MRTQSSTTLSGLVIKKGISKKKKFSIKDEAERLGVSIDEYKYRLENARLDIVSPSTYKATGKSQHLRKLREDKKLKKSNKSKKSNQKNLLLDAYYAMLDNKYHKIEKEH